MKLITSVLGLHAATRGRRVARPRPRLRRRWRDAAGPRARGPDHRPRRRGHRRLRRVPERGRAGPPGGGPRLPRGGGLLRPQVGARGVLQPAPRRRRAGGRLRAEALGPLFFASRLLVVAPLLPRASLDHVHPIRRGRIGPVEVDVPNKAEAILEAYYFPNRLYKTKFTRACRRLPEAIKKRSESAACGDGFSRVGGRPWAQSSPN